MSRPPVLIAEDVLQRRVAELAAQISQEYAGKEIVVLGVLVGAFMFVADLVRRVSLPTIVEFIRASSYGSGRISSGQVRLMVSSWEVVKGRDVLIVEDVLDTGRTLATVRDAVARQRPRSVRTMVLLRKPRAQVNPDYVGFDIDDRFVVGYGLDDGGKWRHLPYIGYVSAVPDTTRQCIPKTHERNASQ